GRVTAKAWIRSSHQTRPGGVLQSNDHRKRFRREDSECRNREATLGIICLECRDGGAVFGSFYLSGQRSLSPGWHFQDARAPSGTPLSSLARARLSNRFGKR